MPICGSGSGVAKVSTAQYTLVVGSYRPRVVGESYTGGRSACSVRSPTSNDSPSITHRQRSSGKSKQFVWRSTIAQLHTSVAFGTRGHHLVEVAAVVDVVVGEEDPPHVLRLDERERVLQPLLAVRRRAGVDDHRLRAADDHRVQVHEQRLTERRLHLVDHERVGGRPRSAARRCVGASGANIVTVNPPGSYGRAPRRRSRRGARARGAGSCGAARRARRRAIGGSPRAAPAACATTSTALPGFLPTGSAEVLVVEVAHEALPRGFRRRDRGWALRVGSLGGLHLPTEILEVGAEVVEIPLEHLRDQLRGHGAFTPHDGALAPVVTLEVARGRRLAVGLGPGPGRRSSSRFSSGIGPPGTRAVT